MKNMLIKIIKMYQAIPGSFHDSCRFYPTCSNYAIEAIDKFGSIKGLWLTIKRLLRCRPFGKSGYDPVPERKIK